MKKLLVALSLAALSVTSYAEGEVKRVCVKEVDAKTKKEKEVCKNMKVHKKLDVKDKELKDKKK